MVRIAYFGTDGCPGHHVIPDDIGNPGKLRRS